MDRWEDDEDHGGMQSPDPSSNEGFMTVGVRFRAVELDDGKVVEQAEAQVSKVDQALVDWAMRKAVKRELDKLVTEGVKQQVFDVIRTELQKRVEKVLDSSWKKFDQYGQMKGSETLEGLVRKLLDQQADTYNRGDTWLQRTIREEVTKRLSEKEFKVVWEGAQASFKKEVDEILKSKIATGLREAFGLR